MRALKYGLAAMGLAALAVLIVVLVASRQRVLDLEATLSRVEHNLESSKRELADYRKELSATRQAAEAARELGVRAQQTADAAQTRAEEEERKTQEIEVQRRAAESAAQRSQHEADIARATSEQAQSELDALRRKRQEELDRMQEALSRIAPTTRTPLGMVVELGNESLRFDFDKATLRPANRELLSRIAGVLLASHGCRLFVYGHTDDIGTDDYNLDLSQRRADAVADYLVRAGVPNDIMTRKGFGKSSPRVKGTTRAARERNRRVEIGIVDTVLNYDLSTAAGRTQK